jgi:hypothetical protein
VRHTHDQSVEFPGQRNFAQRACAAPNRYNGVGLRHDTVAVEPKPGWDNHAGERVSRIGIVPRKHGNNITGPSYIGRAACRRLHHASKAASDQPKPGFNQQTTNGFG